MFGQEHQHRWRYLRELGTQSIPNDPTPVRVDLFYCETCLAYAERMDREQDRGMWEDGRILPRTGAEPWPPRHRAG